MRNQLRGLVYKKLLKKLGTWGKCESLYTAQKYVDTDIDRVSIEL
jgi:hypothetical protein